MLKPIGLLGGTFDPVHYGHLRMAMEVRQELDLAEVRLIPLHTAPHRNNPIASPEQRVVMLRLALEKVSGLLIDRCELQRGGISYSVDTVKACRQELGGRPLCLIMGMDAFQSLNSWHEWALLLNYVHVIVVDRPGNKTDFTHREIAQLFTKHSTEDPSVIRRTPAGRIHKLNIPMLDISATRIRRLLAVNRDVRYLLPDNVIEYIQQQGLYQ
ncbi:MAG: nicotinate-nucleotide adenylyltransferase [Gammaproteobacteria bacterium]